MYGRTMIPLRQMLNRINSPVHLRSYRQYSDTSPLGSGAGKGGGAGGSIREAGGKFGEIGAASEEMYFRKKNSELVEKIKKKKAEEIHYHKEQMAIHLASKDRSAYHLEQIKRHEDAIQSAQRVLDDIDVPQR